MSNSKIELLAIKFSELINEELTIEELNEVNRLNATPDFQNACATHEYIDSNETMIEACLQCGFEFDSVCNSVLNSAWTIAKKAEFNPQTIRTQFQR